MKVELKLFQEKVDHVTDSWRLVSYFLTLRRPSFLLHLKTSVESAKAQERERGVFVSTISLGFCCLHQHVGHIHSVIISAC